MHPRGFLTIASVLVTILLSGMLLAACDDQDDTENGQQGAPQTEEPAEPTATIAPTEPAPAESPTEAEPTTEASPTSAPTEPAQDGTGDDDVATVLVYLVRGEKIGVASRDIATAPQVAAGAMNELLTGTTVYEQEVGLHTEIPEGTRLLDIAISDGVATVDLSQEFESGGGSLSMTLRVAQVVHTLTQFDTVDAVDFRIEGQDVDSIGGEGLVVEQPVTRTDFEDVVPAILVESPTPGEIVASPIQLSGTANTFEATFQVEIIDNSGQIIYEDFVTATSGSGERGTFDESIQVEITREGIGALVVYEESARDGSRTNVVEIPVDLRAHPPTPAP